MSTLNITIPERKLKVWADMENCNQHGERLESIARFFCMNAAENQDAWLDLFEAWRMFHQINELHDMRGYLDDFLHNLRGQCRHQLRASIFHYCGAEVLNTVNP